MIDGSGPLGVPRPVGQTPTYVTQARRPQPACHRRRRPARCTGAWTTPAPFRDELAARLPAGPPPRSRRELRTILPKPSSPMTTIDPNTSVQLPASSPRTVSRFQPSDELWSSKKGSRTERARHPAGRQKDFPPPPPPLSLSLSLSPFQTTKSHPKTREGERGVEIVKMIEWVVVGGHPQPIKSGTEIG